MKRDLGALETGVHDLLVIGAGIYGAAIARDAALRGLKVAVIDRGDFGGATSHNSLKIIHGGLRYLQHLDLWRLRRSAWEQQHWLAIAPHLVRPLAFILPTYGHGSRGPEVMRAALRLYEILAGGRAGGGIRLPRGQILTKEECLERVPGLAREGLSGGAVWYEAQLLNADRVLLECVADAATHGAVVANYVAAERFLGSAQAVEGVHARDQLTGDPFTIRAKMTVNACGPFATRLLRRLGATHADAFGYLSKGINLVTRRPLFGHAIGVSSRRPADSLVPRRDGRLYFITPWHGRAVIGTSHLPYEGDPDEFRCTDADLDLFLAEINEAYPPAQLSREDVLYCYAGLTAADRTPRGGEVRRARRGRIVDHARRERLQGLLTVQGVKYTTARPVAEAVVDRVFEKLGRRAPPCRTGGTPLPGAVGFTSFEALERDAAAIDGDRAELGRLVQACGTGWRRVCAIDPGRAGDPAEDLFRRRVRHAVRHEMAVRLDDVVLRRLEHAALGLLDQQRLAAAAAVMAAELGWDAARCASERHALEVQLRERHAALAAPARPAATQAELLQVQP